MTKKKLPSLCVMDTNVPIVANDAVKAHSEYPPFLIEKCVEAIRLIIAKKALVLDDGDEIYDEYKNYLSFSGQPGLGDRFFKWAHDTRYSLAKTQRVKITKSGDSYQEFPSDGGLVNFDISDRKFVAVANAHPKKPPIIEATDSKWWGFKDALKSVGITVIFMDENYIEQAYKKKMGA